MINRLPRRLLVLLVIVRMVARDERVFLEWSDLYGWRVIEP